MELTFNTFEGGLNKNTSYKNIAPNQYVEANDISLFAKSEFGEITPIKGTTILRTLIAPATYSLPSDFFQIPNIGNLINVIAFSECYVKKDGKKVKSHITVISRPVFMDFHTGETPYVNESGYSINTTPTVYDGDSGSIIASDAEILQVFVTAEDNSFHQLVYEETFNTPIHRGKTGDIVRSGSDDAEVVYLNTGAKLMQFVLDHSLMPFSKSNAYLIPFENMKPPTVNVNISGSLLSGTYSFMVRMYDSKTKKFTKFSLPSAPVLVYNEVQSSHSNLVSLTSSSIGSNTGLGITISTSLNASIAGEFDYYQVAVIKNIDGNGVASETLDLLPLKYKGTSNNPVYLYRENSKESIVNGGEYLIDDAPIDSFSGVAIHDNLFLGAGTTYKNLSYDRGNITIDADSGYKIVAGSDGADLGKPAFNDSSKYYFRGEVYRFALSYHDDFGNWSDPFVLDMSVCTNNEAAEGSIDYKFPAIFQEPILTNTGAVVRKMALTLEDITNHPTWAKGVAVLRAERIRNIQFQSPLIHSMAVMPLDAKTFPGGSYPQGGDPEVSTAQIPSGILGTLIPKNLQDIVPKHIIRGNEICQYKYGYENSIPSQQPKSGSAYTPASDGGRESIAKAASHVHFVFPPNNLYNNANISFKPYVHSLGDRLDFVDIQTSELRGEYLTTDTKILADSAEYIYHNKAQYYSATKLIATDNLCNTGKAETNPNTILSTTDIQVLEYKDVPYGSNGVVLTSSIPSLKSGLICNHDGMLSKELNEGTSIFAHKMGAIVTSKPLIDLEYVLFDPTTDQAGVNALTGTSGLFVKNIALYDLFTNKNTLDSAIIGLINTTNGCNNPSENKFNFNSVYLHTPIVNVTKGLRDDRYGAADASHRFYFTGAYHRFSNEEILNNTPITLDVYGGDCNYDLHTFKIAESTYYVPDANKTITESESKRINGASFYNTSRNYEVGRPLPNLGHIQQISVFLESEIKAVVMDRSTNNRFSKVGNVHTIPIPENLGDGKTPFTYQFNLDIAKDFDDKTWVKQPKYISDNRFLLNRIHYSDVRIMQSDLIGFDKFRAGNFYDIDESHGKIAKIVNSNNNVYVVSERSIQILPIFSNTIETASGSILYVRNNEAIGRPRIISSVNGTFIDRAICHDKDGFYFIDTNQNQIMYVSGESIISLNLELDSYLSENIAFLKQQRSNIATLIYDYVNQDLIFLTDNISNKGINMIWSKRNGKWVTDLSKSENFQSVNGGFSHGEVIFAGLFSNPSYAISKNSNSHTFLGSVINPKISFIINKDPVVPKIFDVFDINMDSAAEDIVVETFDTFPNQASQQCSMIIANNNKREGLFRIPILRHENQRMRGLYAKATINFNELENSGSIRPSLYSVGTKFRYSSRIV